MLWKVVRDDKMLPPIHTRYLRSGGATTRTFTEPEPPSVLTSLYRLQAAERPRCTFGRNYEAITGRRGAQAHLKLDSLSPS